MTAKEYLSQGYRLEQRIKALGREIEELHLLSVSIPSSGFEEHYNASRNTDAPFVKVISKILDMEAKQADLLDRLISFKGELCRVIDSVQDCDEHLVLRYRYLSNMTWVEIGDELGWDERTIRRMHNRALAHVVLPEHPTIVDTRFGGGYCGLS